MHENDSERGAILITVALVLVMLLLFLALAIDVGVGYAERRKMQNAAHAGSLAGAWVLATSGTDAQVRTAVNEYTIVQNEAGSFVAKYLIDQTVGPAVGGGSIPSDATGVQVTAIGSAPTFIAGMIGINQMTASALGEAVSPRWTSCWCWIAPAAWTTTPATCGKPSAPETPATRQHAHNAGATGAAARVTSTRLNSGRDIPAT